MELYSLPEVVKQLGVPYGRIYYAVLLGVATPLRSGHSRLFTKDDVQQLKAYLVQKGDTKKRKTKRGDKCK